MWVLQPTPSDRSIEMADLSPLRRRMIEDMTVRNLSPATQRSYISAVSKFSRYFGKSPDRLELEDVRAFQVHLVSTGISWPALNQIVCALRFFYGVTSARRFADDVESALSHCATTTVRCSKNVYRDLRRSASDLNSSPMRTSRVSASRAEPADQALRSQTIPIAQNRA